MSEQDRRKEKLEIDNRIIVFIGAEGSGKTTVAKRLAEESRKPYITTGDTIRDLATNDPGLRILIEIDAAPDREMVCLEVCERLSA